MLQTIETTTGNITIREDGIVEFHIKKGAYIELEHQKENVRTIKEYSGGKKVLLFADMRGVKGSSKASRDHFSANEPDSPVNA